MTEPTRQAIAVQGRSGKLTVSGKLKVAIDLMLYEGACRKDAAAKAGMTDHSVRAAMRKAHVLAYYNEGLQVLRTSERARNIRRLAEIRDQGNGTPAVNAVRALEQLAEQDNPAPGAAQRLPGLIVQINVPIAAPAPRIVTPDPTIPPGSSLHAFGLPPPAPPIIHGNAHNVPTQRERDDE